MKIINNYLKYNILIRKLTLFWVSLTIIFLITNHYLSHPPRIKLPFPTDITSVDIIRADMTLTFKHSDKGWTINNQPSEKFVAWFSALQTSCPQQFARETVKLGDEIANITMRLNGHDDWIFATYNEFSHAHYLLHNDIAYLCHEQFKPRLTLPPSYWLGTTS